MTLLDLCVWLKASDVGTTIAQSEWLFPTIETVHVLALTLVVGSIAMLDLRLLGVSSRDRSVTALSADTLPWTWGAFVVAAISGGFMFISAATKYYENTPFRIKLVLLALAGVNMAVFQFTTHRRMHEWGDALPTPVLARTAATLSLLFWVGVVFAGRWVGFV